MLKLGDPETLKAMDGLSALFPLTSTLHYKPISEIKVSYDSRLRRESVDIGANIGCAGLYESPHMHHWAQYGCVLQLSIFGELSSNQSW